MRRFIVLAFAALLLGVAAPAWAECNAPLRDKLSEEWISQAKWPNGTNKLVWPPNDGAQGVAVPVVLEPGMLLDRYGCDDGRFLSPRGTAFAARALPYACEKTTYSVYRVVRPLVVWTAKALPWFGQKGGATQFQTDATMTQLLADGVIETVPASRPDCGT